MQYNLLAFSNIYSLIETKKWNRIKTLKNPGNLCYHSAIVVNDSMFIYGGERGDGNSISELWRYRYGKSIL